MGGAVRYVKEIDKLQAHVGVVFLDHTTVTAREFDKLHVPVFTMADCLVCIQ